MSSIVVLGAGMVGSAMAIDMAKSHRVIVADLSTENLTKVKSKCPELEIARLNVTDEPRLHALISDCDLVICAVPGFLGFRTLQSIIEAGKDIVDISFFPEDALSLDAIAKANGVTAIVDCGVAPGMDNMILGYYNEKIAISGFECLVGGLPKLKKWPFNYKAPFSPIDVIEEYTRPARYVEKGNLVVREALSDIEHVHFDKVGTLESFNSDGLRSIIHTMPHIPNMKEKTLRYPGHADHIRALKESGFFSEKPILIGDAQVNPLSFTCKILFDEWKLGDEEEEITVMRVTLDGKDASDNPVKIVYDLYDEYDPDTKTSSMARTTGYTATAAAHLVLNNLFTEKGVFPPEKVGKYPACYQAVIKYLGERGIYYKKRS